MNFISGKLKKSFFIVLIIIVSSCARPVEKIVIISTNDMHAAIDKFPNLATLVEQYRAVDSSRVLLVDAGDRWTGNPYVDLAEPKCYPIIELMNTLRYDVATMGNHEFDYGMELLSARMKDATFDKVLANADHNGSNLPIVPPYVFRTVAGAKICFLGFVSTAVDGHPEGKKENFETAKFINAFGCAQNYASLRDSCDIFVALSHIGYENDSMLAATHPQFDLIVSGHTHTVLPRGVKVGNTMITQTGKGLKYAGVTTITVQGDKILDMQNTLVMLDTIPPSPRYQAMVAGYKNNPTLQRRVGSSSEAMDKTALLNLMSDVLLDALRTDVALFNKGSVRIDALPKGDITVGDIFAMEPFSNSPYIVRMSAGGLKKMIMDKFNAGGKEGFTMDIYPAGLSYRIVTDSDGRAVDVVFSPQMADSRPLKVAMSDYMYLSYKFEREGDGVPTGLLITDMAMDYLSKHSPVTPPVGSRVLIGK